jgi:hypothetical protein
MDISHLNCAVIILGKTNRILILVIDTIVSDILYHRRTRVIGTSESLLRKQTLIGHICSGTEKIEKRIAGS